jgi:ankyrin repeat protein
LQPSDTRPSSELVKPDNSVAVSKSALFAAVRAGDGVRVASLLKKGADIEWQDAVGQRALFKAIFYEKEAVARVLIESGADVNAVDQDNVSSLHEAISRGLRGTVELMIKKGADIHARRRDRVALEAAVDFKRAGLVRLLIDKGADVNSIGGHQFTPLHRCALSGNGDVKIAEILLENAANPNQGDEDGRKPLHFAVLYGFCDLVGLLLKYGAEINSIDNVYTTPLMVAAAKAQEAIIEILLEHHPDLTIIQSETEASAIHFAAKGGSPKVVQSMLYRGLSANSKDKWGRTPLFYTAEHNHPLCTTVLLNGGANRWLVDNKGRTALWLAARNGNDRIVDMLVDDDDDDAAADINMGDLDGVTPLHVAAAYGHFEAVKVLLQHGADLNVVDKDGHKPIDMAEHKGEERLVDLLLTEEQRARKE